MIRISRKVSNKIMAAAIAAAVVLGAAGAVRLMVVQSFADGIGRFDPVFYAQTYPDVAAVLGTDAEALYNHYITCGQAEGRVPYAGAAAGETVEGIADTEALPSTDTAAVPAAQAGVATHSLDEATLLWYQGLPHGYQPDYSQFRYTAEQMAMLAQKQKEFDEGGYVHVGWTEEQVYARLMWIKENLFPEGTKVGKCDIGAGYIYSRLYGTAMNFNCGWDIDAEEEYYPQELFPDGYVSWVTAYKTGPSTSINTLVGGLENRLRVGDVIYTTNAIHTGHVAVVLSHNDRGITVVESNLNGDEKMHWGRFISWDELYNGRNESHVGGCSHIRHYLY